MQNTDSNLLTFPALSVVTVSAFETERLERTLASLLDLGCNFEHIVVIPKSDLVSHELVRIYQERVSYPILVSNDSGDGIYPAMNIGLESSKGMYVLFLNAGDEILDSRQFDANIQQISKFRPSWAILGSSLPWNSSYSTYPGMAEKFARQENGAYVSHQTILADRNLLRILRGFDTSFKIAADTLLTMKMTAISTPLLLEGIAIKVESGNMVTKSNRLSRFETFRAILKLKNNMIKVISLRNFLWKEMHFVRNKFNHN